MDLADARQHEHEGRDATWQWQSQFQKLLIAEIEARNGRLPETSLEVMVNQLERAATGPAVDDVEKTAPQNWLEGLGKVRIEGPPELAVDAKTTQTLKSANVNVADAREAVAEAARIESRQVAAPVKRTLGPDAGGPSQDGEGLKVSGELHEMRDMGGLVAGTGYGTETTDGMEVTTSVDAVSIGSDDWHGARTRHGRGGAAERGALRARGAERDPEHRGREPEVLDWDADWHDGRAREHRESERRNRKDMSRSRGVVLKAIYGVTAAHHGSAAHQHEVAAENDRQGARDGRAEQLQAKQRGASQFDGMGL